MSMNIAALNSLLEKTSDWDKDERYMATNDLCNELAKDIQLDENMEKKICAAILKQLDDQSNDVQSVAVKCLGILLKKVQQAQIGEICEKLCNLILEGKDALRDIYSIGLKTLIADIPGEMGPYIAERLPARLIRGISNKDSEDIKRECLDILADLLRRFGHVIASREHDMIMSVVIRQLNHDRPVIRKRAANCLGSLAVVLSDSLLNRLVEIILDSIDKSTGGATKKSGADIRTLIQTIGTISRTVGFRLGKYLDRLIPVFLKFCGNPNDESQQNDAANELRENCFPGLESFVLRCPREVTPYLPEILKISLAFMKYDPNYCYEEEVVVDEDDDPTLMDTDEGDEEIVEEDDYVGSDDDDNSWKIRKAAVKVVLALIIARPEMLPELYSASGCADELILRFKEREENVRLDVISCFTSLLNASIPTSNGGSKGSSSISSHQLLQATTTVAAGAATTTTTASTLLQRHKSLLSSLESRVPAILRAIRIPLTVSNGKSISAIKGKTAVFSLLKSLVIVLQGGLESYMPQLIGILERCFAEKNQTLSLEALQFYQLLLDYHSPSTVQFSIPKILPIVLKMTSEDWYKIASQSLHVVGSLANVMRPANMITNTFHLSSSMSGYQQYVNPIFVAIFPRLQTLDMDLEVKEATILTIGKLFYHFGDVLVTELQIVLVLLLQRLDTEVTRVSALKALGMIASSPLQLNIVPILPSAARTLSQYLRQQSRVLKQGCLQSLDSLILSYSKNSLTEQEEMQLVQIILHESANLIDDADLHLASLAIKLCIDIIESIPYAISHICKEVLPKATMLARSALVQGGTQTLLIKLFQEIVVRNPPDISFQHLFSSLISSGTTTTSSGILPRQSIANLAKCVAGICLKVSPELIREVVQKYSEILSGSVESKKHLILLCVGELGKEVDLSVYTQLKDLILTCFESNEEETKASAAFALGNLAVGNMSAFLPLVLQAVESTRHQYLLLAALREIIVVHVNAGLDFSPYLDQVFPGLLRHCHAEEEGVRNMVSECFGALVSNHFPRILPVLQNLSCNDADKRGRWTTATSLRYAFSRHSTTIIPWAEQLGQFLTVLLAEPDLEVRKATILMVNAAAHHNPESIVAFLPQLILPKIFVTVEFIQERIVDLGPFKHKVDDGLPLRKVALTCIETILDVAPDRLDVIAFLPRLIVTLSDKNEIKLQTHQILCKLCSSCPGSMIFSVDTLIDPLERSINKCSSAISLSSSSTSSTTASSTATATGTTTTEGRGGTDAEEERQLEILRSALRTVLAINSLADINMNRRWEEFLGRLHKKIQVGAILEELRLEKSLEVY